METSDDTLSVDITHTAVVATPVVSSKTRKRRAGSSPTPPESAPPFSELEAEADVLMADKGKLADKLKKDMMVNYLIESRAGQDPNVNPQHSRASRKQAKELAELIWRLNAETSTK